MGAPVGNKNALKHGLDAKAISVPVGPLAESPEKVTGLVEDFTEQFRPATKLEHALVRRLALATLRSERLIALEAQMLAGLFPEEGTRKRESSAREDAKAGGGKGEMGKRGNGPETAGCDTFGDSNGTATHPHTSGLAPQASLPITAGQLARLMGQNMRELRYCTSVLMNLKGAREVGIAQELDRLSASEKAKAESELIRRNQKILSQSERPDMEPEAVARSVGESARQACYGHEEQAPSAKHPELAKEGNDSHDWEALGQRLQEERKAAIEAAREERRKAIREAQMLRQAEIELARTQREYRQSLERDVERKRARGQS